MIFSVNIETAKIQKHDSNEAFNSYAYEYALFVVFFQRERYGAVCGFLIRNMAISIWIFDATLTRFKEQCYLHTNQLDTQ